MPINNYLKGIMFHHFHDNKNYIKSDGSINKIHLEKLIYKIGRKNILDPNILLNYHTVNNKKKTKYVLTFDDGLRCQVVIASKILKKFKIKAFFFIFSSIFTKKPDLLEVYRHFRFTKFKKIDDFYKDFFSEVNLKLKKNVDIFLKKKTQEIKEFKKVSPYYSLNDIKFRLVRNQFLTNTEYKKIMFFLFEKKKYNYKKSLKKLYMDRSDLIKLVKDGHTIGLHSHSHQTLINAQNINNQIKEYKLNKKFLEKIIKKKICSASYPFGNFNNQTLKALNKIGIKFAFMKNEILLNKKIYPDLQLPRINHSNLVKKFKIR
tara:strand:- start:866 stop:1819 length:954 start_codon:yes stop_codon:yes gene_type:complete